MSHVAVVFGTRPEMIKLAPIIRSLGERAISIHTGQHFDDDMSRTFLEQLRLGEPDYQLSIGGMTRGAQIGGATTSIETILLDRRPAVVLVQGDTNSGLSGALAANSAGVPLVHLEAGLRSFDRAMPEEHNRVMIDALADRCLVPHPRNAELLRAEGVADDRIRVTGSTLREALIDIMPTDAECDEMCRHLGVEQSRFVLATIHRVENADVKENLEQILIELTKLDVPVVLPLHPRTAVRAKEFGLDRLLDELVVVDPLGYREFIGIASRSALMISDSGGVQEEATIVRRPVVIVRNSTERPEILGTFAHLVPVGPRIGEVARALLADVEESHFRLAELEYPYGRDVTSACLAAIDELVGPF